MSPGTRTGAVLAAVAAVLAWALGACSQPEPQGPEGIQASITTPSLPPTTGTPAPAGGWYLALGDSLAAGYQPTTGSQPTRGYAGPVLAALAAARPGLRLRNLGCPGETSVTLTSGGLCSYAQGSQLAAAEAFLAAEHTRTTLVTLDVGANDVLACARPTIDVACARSATARVRENVATVLQLLRRVAPQARVVVLTYYDPLLAAWRQGAAGRQLAAQSTALLGGVNAAIAAEAVRAGAVVADGAAAFGTGNTSGAPEPVNVQRVCAWTWMCTRGDIHPNDEGYAALARAVLAAAR